MSADRAPLTAALLVALRSTGFSVGDHEAPVPPPTDKPYAILYAIPGGGAWGPPLFDHTQGGIAVYQATYVGQRRDQVETLRDRLRRVVLGRTATGTYLTAISPAGLAVIDRDLDADAGVSSDAGHLLWTAVDRYRLTTTPA